MKINSDKCIACQICTPYCPGEAIIFDRESDAMYIEQDKCLECQVCFNSIPCPEKAFENEDLDRIQIIQNFFNNPKSTHRMTGVPGRGTEESKTNDVTGRIKEDEIGLTIELGRPYTGTRVGDISIVYEALNDSGAVFEEMNPINSLMDPETGKMPDDLKEVRLISAIIELKTTMENIDEVIERLLSTARKIQSVFSLGVIVRYHQQKAVMTLLKQKRILPADNVKINLGLGRPADR